MKMKMDKGRKRKHPPVCHSRESGGYPLVGYPKKTQANICHPAMFLCGIQKNKPVCN